MKSLAFGLAVGSLLTGAVALAQAAPVSTPLPSTPVSRPTIEDARRPPVRSPVSLQAPSGSFEDTYSTNIAPHVWSGVNGSFEGIKAADIQTSFDNSESTF
jgi:hypothetical protein